MADSQTQAGTDTEMDQTQTTEQSTDVEAVRKELAAARDALKATNKENAGWRKKLESYEAEEQKRKDAEKTELQKLQDKLNAAEKARSEMEARLVLTAKQTAFFQASAKVNANWASDQARLDAVALVDFSQVEEADMDALVKTLREQRPYLFASAKLGDIDSGAHGKANKADASEKLIADAAKSYGIRYVPPHSD